MFGLDESSGLSMVGVCDAQDLQKKVTEQCKEMETSVRTWFSVCEIDGKCIVPAEIYGVDASERPVFCKGAGRITGSYIRVGESDEHISEYEIYIYDAFGKRIREDIWTVSNAKLSLLDEQKIKLYISEVKKNAKIWQ